MPTRVGTDLKDGTHDVPVEIAIFVKGLMHFCGNLTTF